MSGKRRKKYYKILTPLHSVRDPEWAWPFRQRCLVFPVRWFVLLPVRNHSLCPRICIPLDMVVDHPIPFTPRWRFIHENDETRSLRALPGVCHLGELLHQFLQTMHLEGCPHDDDQIGTFPYVCGLYLANLVTKWVGFVIQDNGRPKCSDLQGTCGTCDSGLGWCLTVSILLAVQRMRSGHLQRAVQSGQSGGNP